MRYPTNPAAVLHRHLKALADFAQKSPMNSWNQGWDSVLLPHKWQDSVGDLLGLYADVIRAVRSQRGVDAGEMLHHAHDWRQAILLAGIPTDKQIAQTSYRISSSAVSALYQVSVAMQHWPQPLARTLSDQKIDGLSAAVNDLRQRVLDTPDLDPDLATYLLDLVEKLQHAVDRRAMLGDQPLRDLVPEVIGGAAANPSLWDRVMESKVGKSFAFTMAALAAVAGLTSEIEQIVGTTTKVVHELHAPAPQESIERGGQQRELPGAQAGPTSTEVSSQHRSAHDDDVIDAEVVEDGEQGEDGTSQR